jgi:hypothetical protein
MNKALKTCGILFIAFAVRVQAADVLTLGTGVQTGLTIDVPVFARDVSGSPLGVDQPAGSRIQSYSIKVTYSPTAPIQSVTFTRAGITAPLTPTFETSPAGAGTITLLDAFAESTNMIPFTSNAAAPGNLIGHLVFTIAPGTVGSPTVNLTIDPTLTQFSNQGGTITETVANGGLSLVNSSFVVTPAAIPALDWRVLILLGLMLAVVALRAQS